MILSDIGGILSIVGSASILFYVCLNRQLKRRIESKLGKNERTGRKSVDLLASRFTYEGINDLYDRVDAIEACSSKVGALN